MLVVHNDDDPYQFIILVVTCNIPSQSSNDNQSKNPCVKTFLQESPVMTLSCIHTREEENNGYRVADGKPVDLHITHL